MTPTEAISTLSDLDAILEFGKLLDQGTTAVIDRIIALADDYLRSTVPAVDTAEQACAMAPDCRALVDQLKIKLGRELMRRTGVWAVVDAIVDAWNEVPSELRWASENLTAIAGTAVGIATSALSVLEDPMQYAMQAEASAEDWLQDNSFGLYPLLSTGADEISGLISSAVNSLVEEIPGLGTVRDAYNTAVSTLLSPLGPVGDVITDIVTLGGLF
jgi:hypothetical protein